ncbi:MAG: hypothetical protein RJA07_1155 [Bacteroidota bacterium]|jgi:hypothetical protein
MSTFFEINRKSKIGYKKLSKADLGISETSNLTHIGLFEDTLEFITDTHKTSSAKLIYQNKSTELVCLIDFIKNSDGTFRSPKIRKGDNNELEIDGVKTNSVVREIRETVVKTNPNENWYLLWFGLENTELVFYLIRQNSKEYNEISNLIPEFGGSRGKIENTDKIFIPVLKYLETKTEDSSIEFLQDLEIIAQTDEIPLKLIKPRYFDIEKAKKMWGKTGRKGEELVAAYLDTLKAKKKITDYNWLNKSRESSFPYDFEITNLTNKTIYTDVKTTSYKFDQKMIFSNQELKFINQPLDYHIYRVYDLDERVASLRVCENINILSKKLTENISTFETGLTANDTKLNTLKLAISPVNKTLSFSKQITLK